ncbi:M23 family metallopeptidase [Staphylospora marina]|uniref:M23 family metallopeptidase n=1 Tax=Staphylospora marina TaxID=2490858 RepID=UPI000F5BCD21|nr:M23 family metallopeptidase [Staphylospora marina]
MKPEEPGKQTVSLDQVKRRMKWKKLLSTKWFLPAVYVATAGVVLLIAWWMQNDETREVSKPVPPSDTVLPVEEPAGDDMILPVAEKSGAVPKMGFYDEADSAKNKEASLVKYANTYWPHSGMDFARKDGKSFDVLAALDGKVVRVEEHPVVGHQVEIEHENGLITVYQSLDDVKVSKGQKVKKGEVIARAGKNNFEKDAGIHLHFEVRGKNQQAMNPGQYLPDKH